MSAYNKVNGVIMSANTLLQAPLKLEWGFDGVVVSDWTAVRDTVDSASSGQDLMMPGPDGPWGTALVDAVRNGRVSEAAIDSALTDGVTRRCPGLRARQMPDQRPADLVTSGRKGSTRLFGHVRDLSYLIFALRRLRRNRRRR
ncbi:glycoside hydrolase family 3 N-terminal domain-containing protein [Leucobacter sp. HNU]|uniref:glycoside hydrolase family 3 N-terminal domain-containing protein n=1 Tax=Leucobacter sp. HNU TaxID=3236805 RepID=UPI003A811ABE